MKLPLSRLLRLLPGAVSALLPALGLSAQTAPLSPDRVTFYTEPNFRGEALTVEAGAAVENLERMQRSDRNPWSLVISSVRVEGAAVASVYTAAGFGGERLDITRSVPDLYAEQRSRDGGGTWDRAIVSLSVSAPARAVAPTPAPTPAPAAPPVVVPAPAPRPEPPPRTVVVVPGPPPPPPTVIIREPPRPRLDRRAAEQIVQRAFREVLNRPPDPEGLRTYRDRLMYEGWTERQIIEQLQRSGEARSINADEAITRIYREVLGRDPDRNGLAHYRAKWREGWTQGQIRDDLRRSNEGRDSYIRNTITRAYREVLGREPDPSGYATYEKAMRERGYTERDVRAALMSGDEYRQKMGRGR